MAEHAARARSGLDLDVRDAGLERGPWADHERNFGDAVGVVGACSQDAVDWLVLDRAGEERDRPGARDLGVSLLCYNIVYGNDRFAVL